MLFIAWSYFLTALGTPYLSVHSCLSFGCG